MTQVGLICTVACAVRLLSPVAADGTTPARARVNHSITLAIAKRIRWFIDDLAGMTDPGNLDFVFGTHADLVDGIYPCCGWGRIHSGINGSSFLYIRDESTDPAEAAARQATDKFYQRLRETGRCITPTLSGDNFPLAAFERREEFAAEILAVRPCLCIVAHAHDIVALTLCLLVAGCRASQSVRSDSGLRRRRATQCQCSHSSPVHRNMEHGRQAIARCTSQKRARLLHQQLY